MTDALQQFREWWPLVLSVGGLVAGSVGWYYGVRGGQERSAWRISRLEEDVAELTTRVEAIKAAQNQSGTNLTIIEVTLRQIKEMLTEVREEVKHKADKAPR